MARQTNAMITLDDAKYMVANEGFAELHAIPTGKDVLDREDIEYYINANNNNFSSYSSNRLVPYQLLQPTVLACDAFYSGGNGIFEYTIEYGTGIGWIGIDCNAYGVPDAFTLEWNGKTITSGWIGSTYASLPPQHENNTAIDDNGNVRLFLYKDTASPTSATVYVDGESGVGGTAWDITGICDRPTAWREINPYCVQGDNWTMILKTDSSRSNWCFNRFRLFNHDSNTLVQARKPDGTLISEQLFHDPTGWESTYGGASYEHNFIFDLSFNTTNEEIEIYIKGVPVGAKFSQLYAVNAHAGTAVRYQEDPAATGYTATSGADLTYINMDFLKFDQDPSGAFLYVEYQNLTDINSPYEFYGRVIDVSNNNLDSSDIDQLITGIDENGVQPSTIGGASCILKIDAGLRTLNSQASWNSLIDKGWQLTEV